MERKFIPRKNLDPVEKKRYPLPHARGISVVGFSDGFCRTKCIFGICRVRQKVKIGIVSAFMPHDFAERFDDESRRRLADIQGVLTTPVTALVRGLLARGHEIVVFCLDQSVGAVQHLRGEKISVHILPKRRARYCLADFYEVESRFIEQAVRSDTPDVISAQWSYEHSLAALRCGIPMVVTCHDAPLRCAWIAKNWFTTLHLLVAWRVIRNARRLICVSPYTANHIQKYFRPHGAVDIVPNGLAPEVFQRGKRRLERPEMRRSAVTLCSVGSWGGLKNIGTLLKAFGAVHGRHPAARLVLFGRDLGAGQAAELWARRRNLHHGVVFRGSTAYERILDFLEAEADLLVHPSLVEANPMAIMEAMACAVPVIAGSRSGGVPWTLDEGQCGFLCDIRDEHDLAGTILKAMNQDDQNQALIKRAFASALQRFNQEQTVRANENILQKVLTHAAKQRK